MIQRKTKMKRLPTANKSGVELSPLDRREITIYKSATLNRKKKTYFLDQLPQKNRPMLKQK